MLRLIFFPILLTVTTIHLYCQKDLWIGLEGGLNYDHFEINDQGGFISTKPILAGQIGLNMEKEFSEIFSLGTGVVFKTFMEGSNYKRSNVSSADRAFNSIMIPAYFQVGKSLNNALFKISAIGGCNFVYNFDYWDDPNDWFGSSTLTLSDGTTVIENYWGTANLERYFFLLHIGGEIEFPVFKFCRVGFAIKRHFGFSNVIEITKDYSTNGTLHPTAELISTGDFTSTTFQFYYPLSRKNQNKKG